jgi:NAD+ diphosphatase
MKNTMLFRAENTLSEITGDPCFILYKEGMLLTDIQSAEPCLLSHQQVAELGVSAEKSHFIGYWKDRACYAWSLGNDIGTDLLHYSFSSLYEILGRVPEELFAVAGRGHQIISWHQENQFCGRCGQSMIEHGTERAMTCEPCKQMIFPRISPCIIVLVVRGDEVLLAQGVGFPDGMYSTLAGFMEAGETPEETVRREVNEETGIQVKNIRYFSSQSWPVPSQLMLGFFADYESGDIVPDPVEIVDAQWFPINQLPNTPPANAISGQLISSQVKTHSAD